MQDIDVDKGNPTIQQMIQWATIQLQDSKIEEAQLDAKYLLEEVLQCDYTYLILHGDLEMPKEKQEKYKNMIEKRRQHVPLQYILGKQEFMGMEFIVDSSVLIPRQDTECLVELVMQYRRPNCKVLDLCCGSGCIGISLASQLFPIIQEDKSKVSNTVQLTLADISMDALTIAKKNTEKHGVTAQIIQGDLFSNINDKYDIIVSNPPYIPSAVVETLMPEVKNCEPRLALDGREDGLYYYREMIRSARNYLNENGVIFFEIGFDQAEDVRKIFVANQYRMVTVKQDLAGLDRIVYATRDSLIIGG